MCDGAFDFDPTYSSLIVGFNVNNCDNNDNDNGNRRTGGDED